MDVTQALERKTPRTRAVIPVHLFGQCVPLAPLRREAIVVIEDAAQAHGATNAAGQRTGTQGDVACFSFFPTKPLGGFGDGGMVTTDNDAFAEKVRLMRVHGAQPKFHHLHVGGNFRLDTLQAALLRLKLPTVDAQAEERRLIARHYREGLLSLESSGDVQWVGESPGTHVYHQLCARVSNRDALRKYLSSRGIGTSVYYPEPLHTQPCFADLKQGHGHCPHAELACREVIAFPCFSGLTESEISEVIDATVGFYSA